LRSMLVAAEPSMLHVACRCLTTTSSADVFHAGVKSLVRSVLPVDFDGQLCCEQSPPESVHWVCNHLKPLLDSDVLRQLPTIRQILVAGNKSTEVLLCASECVDLAPLPDPVIAAPWQGIAAV